MQIFIELKLYNKFKRNIKLYFKQIQYLEHC